MAGADSILPQPGEHMLAVSLEKCALIGARRVKDQMIKAQVDEAWQSVRIFSRGLRADGKIFQDLVVSLRSFPADGNESIAI